MTDKVQKIRKEIQRLQDLTMDGNKNFYSEAAEGEYNALCNIEHFIDSLQKDSVSEELEEAALLHLSKYYDTSVIWDKDKKCVVFDFKAGALWHQNSIWHDANKEKPKIGKAFATIDSDGVMCAEYHVFEGGLTFKQIKEMDNIVKWAYVEDLIPKD